MSMGYPLYGQAVPGGLAEGIYEEASPKPGRTPTVADIAPVQQKQLSIEDIAALEGTPGSSEGDTDLSNGIRASQLVVDRTLPYSDISRPQNVTPNVAPTVENYSNEGGAKGRQIHENTYENLPQSIQAHMDEQGRLEETKAVLTKDRLDTQIRTEQEDAAIARLRREQMQNEFLAKQKQVEDTAKSYSEQLSQTGRFWDSPMNIVAAIGAGLMAFSSPGDRGVGVRLVQQAVMNDWNKRRAAADMHLGELRSNVGAYRQLMGDKEAGDQLSLAESHRVAAMEIQAIAEQFQGPLAKQKLGAMADNMMMMANEGGIKAYQHSILEKERLENPYITKERQATQQALPEGVGPTPFKGTWAPGIPPVKRVTIPEPKTDLDSRLEAGLWTDSSQPLKSSAAEIKSTGGSGAAVLGLPSAQSESKKNGLLWISPDEAKFIDSRVPGTSQRILSIRKSVIQGMIARVDGPVGAARADMTSADLAKILTPAQQVKFNKIKSEYVDAIAKDEQEISKQMAPIMPRIVSYRQLGKDIQVMQMLANVTNGGDVDALLRTRTKQLFGSGNVKKVAEWFAAGEKPTNAHMQMARDLDETVNRFNQLLTGNHIKWANQMFGGSITTGEAEAKKQFIDSDHSFASIKNFHHAISQQVHGEAKNALTNARSNLTKIKWQAYMGQEDPPLSYQGIKGYTGPTMTNEIQSQKGMPEPGMSVPSGASPLEIQNQIGSKVSPGMPFSPDMLQRAIRAAGGK